MRSRPFDIAWRFEGEKSLISLIFFQWTFSFQGFGPDLGGNVLEILRNLAIVIFTSSWIGVLFTVRIFQAQSCFLDVFAVEGLALAC